MHSVTHTQLPLSQYDFFYACPVWADLLFFFLFFCCLATSMLPGAGIHQLPPSQTLRPDAKTSKPRHPDLVWEHRIISSDDKKNIITAELQFERHVCSTLAKSVASLVMFPQQESSKRITCSQVLQKKTCLQLPLHNNPYYTLSTKKVKFTCCGLYTQWADNWHH